MGGYNMTNKQRTNSYMFTINKRNIFDRMFYWYYKRKSTFKTVRRGRHPNRKHVMLKHGRHINCTNDINIDLARSFDVYAKHSFVTHI